MIGNLIPTPGTNHPSADGRGPWELKGWLVLLEEFQHGFRPSVFFEELQIE